MSGQGAQSSASQNTHTTYLWILGALAGLLIVGWYFGHAYIAAAIYAIKGAEVDLISLFTKSALPLKQTIEFTPAQNVSIQQLIAICSEVGNYIRWPAAATLIILGGYIYFYQPTSRYRATHSIESLLNVEKEHWPQLAPIVEENLVDENCDEGLWAMAQTPMQFAQKQGLLKVSKESRREGQLAWEAGYKLSIERGMAARIFGMQLGRHWVSIEALSPYARALFAVFAAKAYRDRDAAAALLAQLSKSAQTALDYTGVDELIEKHRNQNDVRIACESHAYEATVMIAMLQLARTDGVLASAEFLWLKKIDRKLWYVLNTVGRQTAVPEVAGIYAHWKAESSLGKALKIPFIQQAIKALDSAIADVKYVPPTAKEETS